MVPKKIKQLEEKYQIPTPRSTFLPPEKQQNVKTLLRDYFTSLSKHVVKDHQEIMSFEKQNMRILQTKGELSAERRDKLQNMQAAFDKLLTSARSFAEILDENMPSLKAQSPVQNQEVRNKN